MTLLCSSSYQPRNNYWITTATSSVPAMSILRLQHYEHLKHCHNLLLGLVPASFNYRASLTFDSILWRKLRKEKTCYCRFLSDSQALIRVGVSKLVLAHKLKGWGSIVSGAKSGREEFTIERIFVYLVNWIVVDDQVNKYKFLAWFYNYSVVDPPELRELLLYLSIDFGRQCVCLEDDDDEEWKGCVGDGAGLPLWGRMVARIIQWTSATYVCIHLYCLYRFRSVHQVYVYFTHVNLYYRKGKRREMVGNSPASVKSGRCPCGNAKLG